VKSRKSAFSLVELLVVIGIIGILIAILMPVLTVVRQQAKMVKCQSNMRSIGQLLIMYANNNRGWIYPVGDGDPLAPAGSNNLRRLGAALPVDQRWPVYVKGLERWDHPLLVCPADEEPGGNPSYALNYWMQTENIRFNAMNLPPGATSTDFVVMGERKEAGDWFFFANTNEYSDGADPYKHGLRRASNYLFLDLHVARHWPKEVKWGFDLPN